ncbi:MAG: hypothetical protein AB7L09_01955 [Nitrospira sp.]
MSMPKEGSRTPWGPAQHVYPIAEGIVFVSCAGHGGIKLDRKRNAAVPKPARRAAGWYEEDCEASIPIVVHKSLRDHYNISKEEALSSVRRWLPRDYEVLTA